MRMLFWIFPLCMRNIALFNLVFSTELSNVDLISTWMGERLTLQGTVDFSGIFVFYFCTCCFFSHNYGKNVKGTYIEYDVS